MLANYLDGLSNTELFYLGCAVFGGTMFVLRSILILIGMGGDDADGGVDGDGDVGSNSDGSPAHDFRMVSLQTITAFLLMFGLAGFMMRRNSGGAEEGGGMAPWIIAVVATAIGLFTMFVIAKMFQKSRALQSDGTIYPQDVVGTQGTIYLGIRPDCIGKVQLTVRGALKIYDARCADPADSIATGTAVKVVNADNVLVVERLKADG